jgi:hypothetical protein
METSSRTDGPGRASAAAPRGRETAAGSPKTISEELSDWLQGDGEKTLGGLIDVFDEKAFALLFVLLLGVSALPIPTGGATHVFDVIAVLVAAQLVVGREQIWIPQRWVGLQLAGSKQQRFLTGLLKAIRWVEKVAKPRLPFLFNHRLSNTAFGIVVIVFTAGAFFAPPFSGLDTLPALAVVVISLGVLLEDALLVAAGLCIGVAGVVLEVVLGKAAIHGVGKLF